MARVKERYNRKRAEARFARVYAEVAGDRCIYWGMPADGKTDHQPPVYVLHRFADGGLVTKKAIRQEVAECKLVPCYTICNMGLGAYHGSSDNNRRQEIIEWHLADEQRYPSDGSYLERGCDLIEARLAGMAPLDVYAIPAVGRPTSLFVRRISQASQLRSPL